MSEADYKILTPDFRREINASIEKQLAELATCQDIQEKKLNEETDEWTK